MFINDMSSDNRTWRNKAYTNEIVDQQNLPFRYYMIHDYKMFIDVLNIVNNWRSGDWYIVAAFAHVPRSQHYIRLEFSILLANAQ